MNTRLSIGDEVVYTLFSGEQHQAIVQAIEICKEGYKYGRPVSNCDISKHHGTLDLSDSHWCYFHQVKQIIPKRNEQD